MRRAGSPSRSPNAASTREGSAFSQNWQSLRVSADLFSIDATLYGESASRVVVSTDGERLDRLLAAAAKADVPARVIGRTGGDRIQVSVDGRLDIDVAVADAEQAWATAIEKQMGR